MSEGPIVVVGSAVTDITFRVEALPFPGETTTAGDLQVRMGGKGANQAAAARLLGAPTAFIGRVGDDDGGRATREDLERVGIDVRLLPTTGVPTAQAAVVVDEQGENQITVHPGANAHLAEADVEAQRELISGASVYVAQLEVPAAASVAGARVARKAEALTILNAAPSHPEAASTFAEFDIVVMNGMEAEQLMGVGVATLDDALAVLRALADAGAREPVVTLGASGVVFVDRGRGTHVPAPRVAAVDTTGAGDAFVGALAAFLREGTEMEDAVKAATAYAALAVTRAGTRAAYATRE
ncbi:MAG: ribokinase, partial [Planctomycetota bacterium]